MTTWELSNKAITNIKTIEVKVFETNNVMQVRAGKYGEDKVFIIYSETTTSGGNSYGSVTKGTIPKSIIINILKKLNFLTAEIIGYHIILLSYFQKRRR